MIDTSSIENVTKEVASLNKSFQQSEFTALHLIGQSSAFVHVLKNVKKIAAYDVIVSIYGETGTGKELIARAIHYLSSRASHPFIPVNCGSLPDTLFENELFGHERGAFTDAKNTHTGLIAQAEGGTLFLDEVEDLSLHAQAALLRFLQDKQYRALGGNKLETANVRIIAASNVDLKQLCSQGAFRQDLYYRLNVLPITLPPLRERIGDVALLSENFMQKLRILYNKPAKTLHTSATEWISRHSWPGNIRELENTLHRAFLLSDDDIIKQEYLCVGDAELADAPIAKQSMSDLPFNEAKYLVIRDFEKHYLEELMDKSSGNVSIAAKYAEKERSSLGKLLKKYGLNPQNFK